MFWRLRHITGLHDAVDLPQRHTRHSNMALTKLARDLNFGLDLIGHKNILFDTRLEHVDLVHVATKPVPHFLCKHFVPSPWCHWHRKENPKGEE